MDRTIWFFTLDFATLKRVAGSSDFTSDDLTAIRRAIAKGERIVQFADRSVTYRSIDELLQAEARIAAALSTGRSKQSIGVGRKGFGC